MRRLLTIPLLTAVVALALAAGAGARSQAALDIRGDWSMPSVANGTKYPQVWSILTENRKTGAWRGHIKNNAAYLLWGTVVGHKLTIHSKYGTYKSNGKATIVTSGARWRVVGGTFSDTNGTTGTFTGVRLRHG